MGIDVVFLNLKQQLEQPGCKAETFFFQVKTALASAHEEEGKPGAITTAHFKLKASEVGHWYAVIVDQHGQQVPEGYLGTIDSDNEATRASDGADHYSIHGFLEYARGLQK